MTIYKNQQLIDLFKEYMVIGGMPAVVQSWITEGSLKKVDQIGHDLLATYRDDFSKYQGRLSTTRLQAELSPRILPPIRYRFCALNYLHRFKFFCSTVVANEVKQPRKQNFHEIIDNFKCFFQKLSSHHISCDNVFFLF